MVDKPSPIVMEEVTDPEELAKARAQRERFDRNSAWLRHTLRRFTTLSRQVHLYRWRGAIRRRYTRRGSGTGDCRTS